MTNSSIYSSRYITRLHGIISQLLADLESLKTAMATIDAATYADALTQCNALTKGRGALVTIAADESEGNAGTGTDGQNPTTFYIFSTKTGLTQLATYPK